MDNIQRLSSYDIAILGCGAMGSAAAYHLARGGRNVLVVEQFQIGHSHGSSHGGSRIVRYTHDAPEYARQMPATFELWRHLESESGTQLLTLTGGIYAGNAGNQFISRCRHTLEQLSFSHADFDGDSLRERFPQFVFPSHWSILFQAQTGILAASRCVDTMAAEARKHGATIRAETRVEKIVPLDHGVEIQVTSVAGRETIYAQQCVITAGPWVNRLLSQLYSTAIPIRTTHQQVAYFPVDDVAVFAPNIFPIFIIEAEPHFYGFPIFERPGQIKVAVEQSELEIDPDGERIVDQKMVQQLGQLVGEYLPGVQKEPAHVELCVYSETPNRDFVIDRIPDFPHIIVAAGFSGRGFKHAIAVGRLIFDLTRTPADEYSSPFWLENYRIARFANEPHMVRR